MFRRLVAQTEAAKPFGRQVLTHEPLRLAIRNIFQKTANQHPKRTLSTQFGPTSITIKRQNRFGQCIQINNRFKTSDKDDLNTKGGISADPKGNLTLQHQGGEMVICEIVDLLPEDIVNTQLYGTGVVTNIGVLYEDGHKEPWIIAMNVAPSETGY